MLTPSPTHLAIGNHRYSREQLYWLLQIGGWGGIALYYTLFWGAMKDWIFWEIELLVNGTGAFAAVLGTHLLRVMFKRGAWIEKPLPILLYRMVLGTVATSLGAWLLYSYALKSYMRVITLGVIPLYVELNRLGLALLLCSVWSLLYLGVQYVERLQAAEIQRREMETAMKDAELLTLKAQMNPHFMFNCLNSIRALTEENVEKAQCAITQLANILRYALRSATLQTVPLHAELAMVEDYLSLESMRLEKRLRIIRTIDAATLSHAIPPLALQTLVENGIKHGVAILPEGGEIHISSTLYGEVLAITVESPGEIAPTSSTGIGLANTRERLRLLFGSAANLDIVQYSGTVRATLTLPQLEYAKHPSITTSP